MNKMKLFTFIWVFVLYTNVVRGEEVNDNVTEPTTQTPLADTILAENHKVGKESIRENSGNAQPQTIADFIIHPLIALKPRLTEAESGKQAAGGSTTASPWQIFGFNAGQGLTSSVSSLAGTVTGWLGNRIQFPGFVETPVRESVATTTTTARPEIIVKIQQRPNTKRPLHSISNKNEPPFRRYKRPNRYNVVNYADDFEEDDDLNDYNDYENFTVQKKNRRRYQNYQQDDDDDDDEQNASSERNEDEESEIDEEEEVERPAIKIHQHPVRRLQSLALNKRTNSYSLRSQLNQNQRRSQTLPQDESSEEEQLENDEQDAQFSRNQKSKRYQNELNFMQRNQQNMRQQVMLTRKQAAAVETNALNKAQKSNKRLQSGAFLITRNGQTVYMAPELVQVSQNNHNRPRPQATKKPFSNRYTQTTARMPLKRKTQPSQYITIPWDQLGMLKATQLFDQSKPAHLTVPQDVIQKLGNQRKNPNMVANAVSQSPRIVPARPAATLYKRPATIIEKPLQKNKETNENSSESIENEDPATPYIVIPDEAPYQRKLSPDAYRQILDYFNQKRFARQLNEQETPISKPNTAESPEQSQLMAEAKDNMEPELKATTDLAVATEIPQMQTESDKLNESKSIELNI